MCAEKSEKKAVIWRHMFCHVILLGDGDLLSASRRCFAENPVTININRGFLRYTKQSHSEFLHRYWSRRKHDTNMSHFESGWAFTFRSLASIVCVRVIAVYSGVTKPGRGGGEGGGGDGRRRPARRASSHRRMVPGGRQLGPAAGYYITHI